MNFVLGSRGRLGSAIACSFEATRITVLDRAVYSDWWREGAVDHVSRFFKSSAENGGVVYVAAGILDPRRPVEEHHRVNFLLARNVIEGATKLGLKVVTFGTVMERIFGGKTDNPYFLSKGKLGNFVSEFSVDSKLALHIQIHTLYGGGMPDRFMFLGQLFNAITAHTCFKMSPGTQLREYHHIDDEIAAIAKLVEAEIGGTVDLSHGAPLTLRELAMYIFEQFDSLELLKIGALSGPPSDNYGILFERTPLLRELTFRDAFPSIVEYLRSCKALLGEQL